MSAACAGVAKGAFAIELLFQAAKGLVDRFPAFESDFNHEPETLSELWAEGKLGFYPFFYSPVGERWRISLEEGGGGIRFIDRGEPLCSFALSFGILSAGRGVSYAGTGGTGEGVGAARVGADGPRESLRGNRVLRGGKGRGDQADRRV